MTVRLPERLLVGRMKTPLGVALLVFDGEEHLRGLNWVEQELRLLRQLSLHYGTDVHLEPRRIPAKIKHVLEAYFAGDLKGLSEIECRFGGTPFQQSVWTALRTIPAGQTLSYGRLAARLDRPRAVRAVGAANGSNPISVVIPCHRVIGSDGNLTGYGGGIERKRWLLRHEGAEIR